MYMEMTRVRGKIVDDKHHIAQSKKNKDGILAKVSKDSSTSEIPMTLMTNRYPQNNTGIKGQQFYHPSRIRLGIGAR